MHVLHIRTKYKQAFTISFLWKSYFILINLCQNLHLLKVRTQDGNYLSFCLIFFVAFMQVVLKASVVLSELVACFLST